MVEEVREKLRAGFRIWYVRAQAPKMWKPIKKSVLEHDLPTDRFMFCTDDKHLEEIASEGHIGWNIKKAVALGLPAEKAIKMATIQAADAYGLNHLGAIAPGRKADIVALSDLQSLDIMWVLKNGFPIEHCLEDSPAIELSDPTVLNSVHINELTTEMLGLRADGTNHVIGIIPQEIVTADLKESLPVKDGYFVPEGDLCKLAVLERHGRNGNVSVAPIRGYGIKNGAVATTVAHDSHNLIVVGDNDVI